MQERAYDQSKELLDVTLVVAQISRTQGERVTGNSYRRDFFVIKDKGMLLIIVQSSSTMVALQIPMLFCPGLELQVTLLSCRLISSVPSRKHHFRA